MRRRLAFPGDVSVTIIDGLKGAEYMGSLLRIDDDIERVIRANTLYGDKPSVSDPHEAIMSALRQFIHEHDHGEDLGLRSLAEQLGKGLRLIEILGKKYDVVVANPPYCC